MEQVKSVADVTGKIVYATPNKTVYAQNETVLLRLKGETVYKAHWDFSGEWRTWWGISDEEGNKLASQYCYHTISPLTKEDRATDIIELNCGKAIRPQNYRVRLTFMSSILSSDYIFLDDVYVPIKIVRQPEPSPIPSNGAPPYTPAPAPAPTPEPAPAPAPTPTIPAGEEQLDWQEAIKGYLPWIALVAAVALLWPTKRKK